MALVDTHVHIWDFEKARYSWLEGNTSILNRAYHFDELAPSMDAVGVTAAVLVQAANNLEDTDWMLSVAAAHEKVRGVVGWLPLLQPDQIEKALQKGYGQNPYFKGVRHLIHDEADPKWLLQEAVIESLGLLADADLSYDLVGVLPQHIETALAVAQKEPALRIVFDHLNQPPIASGEQFGRWGELMKEAATCPNFYVKISGLGTALKKKDWGANDIKPSVAFALETFGEDRCFCGGDWPVALLAGTYVQTWTVYREVIESLAAETQRQKIYSENAVKFYRL